MKNDETRQMSSYRTTDRLLVKDHQRSPEPLPRRGSFIQAHIADALIRARFTRLPFLPTEAREGLQALKEVAPQLSATDTVELPSSDGTAGAFSLRPVQFEADVQVPGGGRVTLRHGEFVAPEEVSDCLGGI